MRAARAMSRIASENGAREVRDQAAVEPLPGHESEGRETVKQPHATDPGRWADGTTRLGNQVARKHGRFAASPPPLLPAAGDPPADADPPSLSDRLRAALEADQGGD